MASDSDDTPSRSTKFVRQVSEPSPDSKAFPEKTIVWDRQVSDPGPKGSKRLRLLRGPKVLRRRNSGIDLVKGLHKAAKENKSHPPWALIAAIVIFNVIGKIGDAIGPAIVASRPLQLLILNASNTHCILTTTTVSFLPWIIVGVGRRFCEDPLYFFAGWRYRESCLDMLREYLPSMADSFDKAEGMFRNNLYFAVAVNPGATVCALAGASRMAPVAFFTLNVGSTTAQLLVMRYICLMFPDRVDEALGLIARYMKILVAIMVGITLFGACPMLFKTKQHAD